MRVLLRDWSPRRLTREEELKKRQRYIYGWYIAHRHFRKTLLVYMDGIVLPYKERYLELYEWPSMGWEISGNESTDKDRE